MSLGSYVAALAVLLSAIFGPNQDSTAPVGTSRRATPELFCYADVPSVMGDQKLGLSALLDSTTPQDRYQWSAKKGKVSPEGRHATWTAGGSRGIDTVTVEAFRGAAPLATCKVQVAAFSLPTEDTLHIGRGGNRRPVSGVIYIARALQAPNVQVDMTFGRYTYFLFGLDPGDPSLPDDVKSRYRTAAFEVARQVQGMPGMLQALGQAANKSTIDLLTISVTARYSGPDTGPEAVTDVANFILSRYDWQREHLLVQKFALTGSGPFILTFSRPPGADKPPTGEPLREDLSGAPDYLIKDWITISIGRAVARSANSTFDPAAAAFELRKVLATTAASLSPIEKSITVWRQHMEDWVHKSP